MATTNTTSLSQSSQSSAEDSPSADARRPRHESAAEEFFHAYRFDDTLPLRLEIVDERKEKSGKHKKNVIYIVRVRTGPYADPVYADFNVQVSTESLQQLARDLKTVGYEPFDTPTKDSSKSKKPSHRILLAQAQPENDLHVLSPESRSPAPSLTSDTSEADAPSIISDVELVVLNASPGSAPLAASVWDARRQHWQDFLHSICRSLLASTSPCLRCLLFPRLNLTDWHRLAMQHATMVLNSEGQWQVEERLPGIGWRLAKHYAVVREVVNRENKLMMSWAFVGRKYGHSEVKERQEALKQLVWPRLQHPLIWPLMYETFHEAGCLVMQALHTQGSLKDRIYKAQARRAFHKKYTRQHQRRPFALDEVRLYGRQMLEALNAIHEAGIPYGNLHARNVMIDQGVCRLTDLHNTIIGLPGYYRPYLIQLPKICMFPSIDVYCFGRILYEMTFGEGLDAPCIDSLPEECPSDIQPVLNLLITTEACFDKGMPTVKFLLQAPLFQGVDLGFVCPPIKLSSRVVGICRGLAERYEKRLSEAEKAFHNSIETEGVFYRPISPILTRMKKSGSMQVMRKFLASRRSNCRPACLNGERHRNESASESSAAEDSAASASASEVEDKSGHDQEVPSPVKVKKSETAPPE